MKKEDMWKIRQVGRLAHICSHTLVPDDSDDEHDYDDDDDADYDDEHDYDDSNLHDAWNTWYVYSFPPLFNHFVKITNFNLHDDACKTWYQKYCQC